MRNEPIIPNEPNEETKAAMAELDAGGGETFTGSTEEFFEAIRAENKEEE